mgnify:CR=1 FL=1
MERIYIICEGQTEETFFKELLQQEMMLKGVELIPTLVGKPGHKGGRIKIERIVADARNLLLGDRSAYCTTFVDFYGIDSEFPGKSEATTKQTIGEKAACIQNAMREHIRKVVGEDAIRRFIPYVQMYEFEGLLFSEPRKLAEGICRQELAMELAEIRAGFSTPEDINDSPGTAPSQRLTGLMPEYEKITYGSFAALEIGLKKIRTECKLFAEWLATLESTGSGGAA